MYSLRTSFCTVPVSFGARHALLFPDDHIHREQNRRRRVDRHRGRDPIERDLAKELREILDRIDGDTDPSDLSVRHRVVGVVPHLRRKIECGGQPRLPRREQLTEPAIGLLRRAESGILAHRPQPAGVHRGVDAARKGELARRAEVARRIAGPIGRAVDRVSRVG